MKGHSRLLTRIWVLPVGVVGLIVLLIAGHVILYFVLSHTALSAAIVSGVIILVVIKHLRVLGALYELFRRRCRH